MTGALTDWLRCVIGASLLCCCAMYITPRGRVRDAARLVCGVVLAIALISPVADFDFGAYSESLARYRAESESFSADAEETYNSLTRTVIEENYAAYISDKAAEKGLALDAVSVWVEWAGSGIWYPTQAYLTAPEQTKTALAPVIEAELGIPQERQFWNDDEA